MTSFTHTLLLHYYFTLLFYTIIKNILFFGSCCGALLGNGASKQTQLHMRMKLVTGKNNSLHYGYNGAITKDQIHMDQLEKGETSSSGTKTSDSTEDDDSRQRNQVSISKRTLFRKM